MTKNFKPHKYVYLVQCTKIGIYKNKAIHSIHSISFDTADAKLRSQKCLSQLYCVACEA